MTMLAVVPESDIRPGYNGSGGAYALGTCVQKTAGQKFQILVTTNVTSVAYGVVCDALGIANLAMGNIQIRGIARVLCGNNVTEGARVSADNTGRVVDSVATNVIFGTALEAGTAGNLIEVELAGPNGSIM